MITETIRANGRNIFAQIKKYGRQSVRKIGEKAGASKSSVQRHLKGFLRRRRYPESEFWETEAGQAWLRLMTAGVLYQFGLKCNAGADRLSEFFKLIRADTHIGVSPSALRSRLKKMEKLLPEFQRMHEAAHSGTPRKVIAAGDETFFEDMLVLVLTDLSSGYLLIEETAEDRKYETWLEKAEERLRELGIEVDHAIADRAWVLIKPAIEGFECEPGADLFHAENEVSKWLGAAFHRKLTKDAMAEPDKTVGPGSWRYSSRNNGLSRMKQPVKKPKRAGRHIGKPYKGYPKRYTLFL